MGVAPDPVKVKGLTKPLTLLWDGVGGKFQLVVLPTLHDVDVVLGVDVLSQLNVQFDWVKQVVRPYREPSIPVASARNIGLLFENPDSTFKGKIPVKEEGVKEVAKDMLRPAYQGIRYCYKTKEKEEGCKIVWNQADYKVQLKKDLEDIWQKLCRVLGKELAKKGATRPVNRIEEGVSVDLCEQRSGERGSGCNAPEEIYKSHTLANVFYKSSESFSTPVTSPLMPPKPARTERKHYSWRNSSKREICMNIRVLDPLELRNDSRKESMYENKRSTNYREAEYLFPDGEGVVALSESNTSALRNVSINKLVARQRWKTRDRLCSYTEKGCRKVVKSYNKVVTVMTFYCILVTQVLEGITSPRRCEKKSTVGNSERFSSSTSVRDYGSYAFYSVLECLGDILGYKLKLWPFLIIHGLWRKYGVMRK